MSAFEVSGQAGPGLYVYVPVHVYEQTHRWQACDVFNNTAAHKHQCDLAVFMML